MQVNIEQLIPIVREAGEFMLGSSETGSTLKTNAKDFATVADIKAQDILRNKLYVLYPDAAILSEEDHEDERSRMYEPDFTGFVLDPIDGTYNFKRDMRESAISVGYIKNSQPVCGAIYDPYKDELFTAEKGKGAFRNGKPVRISEQDSLDGASIAISNSYDDEAMARTLKRHLAIYEQSGVMPWTTCAGSGVLILAYVACGRFDAYHHNGLKPWDNAAAFLLIEEAGGVVTRMDGTPAKFTDTTMLAANPRIAKTMLSIFEKIPKELLT